MQEKLLLDVLFVIGIIYFLLFPLFVLNKWKEENYYYPKELKVTFLKIVSETNDELN